MDMWLDLLVQYCTVHWDLQKALEGLQNRLDPEEDEGDGGLSCTDHPQFGDSPEPPQTRTRTREFRCFFFHGLYHLNGDYARSGVGCYRYPGKNCEQRLPSIDEEDESESCYSSVSSSSDEVAESPERTPSSKRTQQSRCCRIYETYWINVSSDSASDPHDDDNNDDDDESLLEPTEVTELTDEKWARLLPVPTSTPEEGEVVVKADRSDGEMLTVDVADSFEDYPFKCWEEYEALPVLINDDVPERGTPFEGTSWDCIDFEMIRHDDQRDRDDGLGAESTNVVDDCEEESGTMDTTRTPPLRRSARIAALRSHRTHKTPLRRSSRLAAKPRVNYKEFY